MCSYIREIVTVQIGHYSNFIGSHWLNLQESSFVYDESSPTDINHDYIFREGRLPNNQDCYIPRLLIIDAKGSLGSLPCLGTLYEPPFVNLSTNQALWSGKVELINQIPEEKNDFLKALEKDDEKYRENLDEDKDICSEDYSPADTSEAEQKIFDLSNKVNVWSDFLRPHLHHKTILLLDEIFHQNCGATAMNEKEATERIIHGWGFQEGANVIKKTEEEVMDRIRILAESCGSLQGFQVLCDGHDGMGGVGSTVAQYLADDYSSKDVFTFVSNPPYYKPETASEIAVFLTNIIQSYTELGKFSSILLPLNLRNNICQPTSEVVRWPYISYKEDCAYESSSILASYLDTISLPWRTKSEPLPMSNLSYMLTPLERKVVGGCFSFPVGLQDDLFLCDWLAGNERVKVTTSMNINERMKLKPIGGGSDLDLPKFVEVTAVRGISKNKLESGPKRMKYETAWQLYEHYLKKKDEEERRRIVRHVSGARDPLNTRTPFPQIFTDAVNDSGYLKTTLENEPSIVTTVPAVANIYQGQGIQHYLKSLFNAGAKIDVSKLPKLATGELEKDAWRNVLEDFLCVVNRYKDCNYDEGNSD